MLSIEIKTDLFCLATINNMWSRIQFDNTTEGKVHKSIAELVMMRFIKKQLSRITKPNTKFNLVFNYHEAYVIEKYLRAHNAEIHSFIQSLEYNTILDFCNTLHQKLA